MTCMNCEFLPLIPSNFPLSPSPQKSASHPALPLLDSCSPSSSPGTSFCDMKPQVMQSSPSPEREDPFALPPASDIFTSLWPVGLSAPAWLFPLSVTPETLFPCGYTWFPRPTSSTLVSHHSTYATDLWATALSLTTPTASVGSSFPPIPPLFQSHRLRLRCLSPQLRLGLQCQRCHSSPSTLCLRPGIHRLLRWSSH